MNSGYRYPKVQKQLAVIGVSFFVFVSLCVLLQPSNSYGFGSTFTAPMKSNLKDVEDEKMCQSLLQEAVHTRSIKEVASKVKAQEKLRGNARMAAAGILFGAKYAYGPVQRTSENVNDEHILAIKEYRNCRKMRALKQRSL